MKSTNPKPIEFTKRSNERAREQRQTDFLRYLAQGESITDTCILIGISRSCYEKWRKHPEFRAAVESARESHRRDILSGFHTADAYARMLLDAIQRDESLPAALRYRASKSILSRKGKTDWLPEPLPAATAPLAPWESEEDQQPGEHPHADPAPAPQPHSTNHVESIPNPRPAGPIIVNATASRTTTPAPTELASAPHANTMPPSEIAPALAEYIPSDSLFPVYGSNPENPDKTPHPQSTANTMENQQYPSTQPVSSRPLEFCNNPETLHPAPSMEARATSHPAVHESEPAAARIAVEFPANESLHPSADHASAGHASSSAPAAPSASSSATTVAGPSTTAPSPAITLSQTWLSAHFLHQHESPKRFEALLNNHIRTYQPSTPAEELLVFRITQKSWLLRRLETWERVIADSQVARIRQRHPNTAAPAAIALSFLEAKETAQTRFQDRIAKLRNQHEAALVRLTAKLETQQLRREAAHLRAQHKNPPCPTNRPGLSFTPTRASIPHDPVECTGTRGSAGGAI